MLNKEKFYEAAKIFEQDLMDMINLEKVKPEYKHTSVDDQVKLYIEQFFKDSIDPFNYADFYDDSVYKYMTPCWSVVTTEVLKQIYTYKTTVMCDKYDHVIVMYRFISRGKSEYLCDINSLIHSMAEILAICLFIDLEYEIGSYSSCFRDSVISSCAIKNEDGIVTHTLGGFVDDSVNFPVGKGIMRWTNMIGTGRAYRNESYTDIDGFDIGKANADDKAIRVFRSAYKIMHILDDIRNEHYGKRKYPDLEKYVKGSNI